MFTLRVRNISIILLEQGFRVTLVQGDLFVVYMLNILFSTNHFLIIKVILKRSKYIHTYIHTLHYDCIDSKDPLLGVLSLVSGHYIDKKSATN